MYKSPTYDGGFDPDPFPDRYAALILKPELETVLSFSAGIKTVTHDRMGLACIPTKYVVLEMISDGTTLTFDLTPGYARALALKLEEFAKAIEEKK